MSFEILLIEFRSVVFTSAFTKGVSYVIVHYILRIRPNIKTNKLKLTKLCFCTCIFSLMFVILA